MNTIARKITARFTIRRTLAALVAAAAVVGGVVLTGGSAHAATSVTGCFQFSNGAAYANRPVNLQQWNGSRWVSVRSGKTNASGCGTFYNTSTGVYYTMSASLTENTGYWINQYSGWAPSYSHTGSGNGWVGTGTVYLVNQYRSSAGVAADAWGY